MTNSPIQGDRQNLPRGGLVTVIAEDGRVCRIDRKTRAVEQLVKVTP